MTKVNFVEEKVKARSKVTSRLLSQKDVEYMDVAPNQIVRLLLH